MHSKCLTDAIKYYKAVYMFWIIYIVMSANIDISKT